MCVVEREVSLKGPANEVGDGVEDDTVSQDERPSGGMEVIQVQRGVYSLMIMSSREVRRLWHLLSYTSTSAGYIT